ncbi:MAG: Ldh family oxidoreductase [Nitrososphaeria archaeon]
MTNYLGKVRSEDLLRFCIEVFSKVGVPRKDAEVVSEHLVTANLRGVDSHGAFVRVPHYVSAVQKGVINPRPKTNFIKNSPSLALVDGDNGFGPVVAMKAAELAIKKAKRTGIGLVGARNMSHVGMLARYTLRIVEENMIGMAATNSSPIVVPWGGTKPVFGTNPFTIGFPVNRSLSIIVDMATSVVAAGKIAVYASKGERIPEGWAFDKDGKLTTDPKAFLDKGMLLPFGGYKGYGLCLSVEVFAGLLTGSAFSSHIARGWATQGGFLVEAININSFRPYSEYSSDILELIQIIKSTPPAEGFNEVLLPGEPERREYEKRASQGIPVYQDSWENLTKVSQELGVDMPQLIK